jgi:hypothetical protein
MTIHFASFIKYIPSHTHSNFMYFFSTKPMSSNDKGSIKFGITETQTLHKRLGQYKHVKNIEISIIPVNIYYIHTDNVAKRESILKRMMNSHPELKCYQGAEYFEGNIVIMLNMFAYIALATLDEVNTLYIKKSFKSIIKRIRDVKYDITYITQIFPYTEDDNDIEHIVNKIESEYNSDSEYNSEDSESDTESDIISTEFPCPKCGKYCKDKRGLGIHEVKCISTQNFTCIYCNVSFCSRHSLSRHSKTCKHIDTYESKKEYIEKNKVLENTIIELKQALEEKEINPIDTLSNKLLQDRIIQLELLCKEKDLHIHFLTKSLEDKEAMINDKNFIIDLLKK